MRKLKKQFLSIGFMGLLMLPAARAAILAGPVTNSANRHIYYLLGQNTWLASRAEALSLGGDLAVVRNQAENNFLTNNFSNLGGVPRGLWIGLSDQRRESCWEWESGDPSVFFNWATNEPNGGINQNFAFIRPSFTNASGQFAPSKWNDSGVNITSGLPDGTVFPLHGVAEVIPATFVSNVTIRTTAVEISWPSQSNTLYQVQWASILDTNTWKSFGGLVQGNGTTNTVFDTTSWLAKRFYRVIRKD